MKFCRFDDDRLGVIDGEEVADVSEALAILGTLRWPVPMSDGFIQCLDEIRAKVEHLLSAAKRLPLTEVTLRSPVANPSKIICAPINYQAHIDEARIDPEISTNKTIKNIWDWGLFLKANSSLIGFGEEIRLRHPERRNDHEIELVVVIGKPCSNIDPEEALEYVAGYAMGLDITIRGPELPSFRKSSDTYAVCGPWLVTKDEIPNPNILDMGLKVNDEVRQSSNTNKLVYSVEKLISYASSFYTLLPGDLIYTGTPEGVGPIKPGDVITCWIDSIATAKACVASDYLS
jgi:2-keto-4-pentenoate hydratase/2-oxohepta-3-ene-1,7-dioic acid hydratase in catechol pathway